MRATALLLASLAGGAMAATHDQLVTIAERSGFRETGRYEEVERLCPAFERAHPGRVRCETFGTTPEGRPMLALVASAGDALDPKSARRKDRPVVLFQGGIHSGEIDGKDAGFLLLRELLEGTAGQGLLSKVTFVFVPVFSVDGHERFGRWNRPNQRGPEAMGWRTTAQNLNLNRDYTKADAPEMQAMLRLLERWDPIVYGDLHVTDGAEFRHDIAVIVDPCRSGDPDLARAGARLRDDVLARLDALGSMSLPFYPSFVVDDDPSTGFEVSVMPPRFSNGYWSLRNRFGMLVETHSWKDYPTRVRSTRNTVLATLELAARDGAAWLALARAADERAARLGGATVPLAWEVTEKRRTIEFQGYAYAREPSAISGRMVTRYDATKPEVWRVPLADEVRPKEVTTAPTGGYVVTAGHAGWMAEKLSLHGVSFVRLPSARAGLAVETFRADRVAQEARSFEGRQACELEGAWKSETRDVPAGSLYVPLAQPKARLVLALLEPRSGDSFAAWGFFSTAFEKKEYMEAYVVEDFARELLAKDPEVAAEFAKRLGDAAFAADPAARLEFFHRLHPSWDERLNLYPVYRTASAP